MSSFTGAIAYVNLNETATTAATATNFATQGKASALSLAGMYDAAPFYGSFGYEDHKLDTVRAGGKESAWKLGLGYTMEAFTLGFAYEKTSDNLTVATGANRYGHNAYYLSGQYKFGSDAVKFAYGKAGQLASAANTGANQYSLGYDHGLSKRTRLYALYSRLSNQSAASYGFSQSTATTGNATINGIGASPSVFSFGIKHSF